jgi:hypothetical protein
MPALVYVAVMEVSKMVNGARGNEALTIERRQNTRLRSIFPDARIRIAHFFHEQNDWAGSSIDYLAHRLVHEAYPDLGYVEVCTLVAAIENHLQVEFARIRGMPFTP